MCGLSAYMTDTLYMTEYCSVTSKEACLAHTTAQNRLLAVVRYLNPPSSAKIQPAEDPNEHDSH